MPSVIITLVIAAAFALMFQRKYVFLVFSLASLGLIVPVRWVVFPTSQYLASMSAKQIFDDMGYTIGESFMNVFYCLSGGSVDVSFAIIGFLGVGAAFNLFGVAFHTFRNQKTETK